jgi:hypothetical protein
MIVLPLEVFIQRFPITQLAKKLERFADIYLRLLTMKCVNVILTISQYIASDPSKLFSGL